MHPARLIALALLAAVPSPRVLAEVDHLLSLSVVQIHAYPEGGPLFFGSGVVVGADKVATNCHVTRRAQAIFVAKGPMRVRVSEQQADPRHDLCLLSVPGLSVPQAQIGSAEQLSVGQTLYFYGFPRAIGMSFSQGRVEALHPFDGSLVIETSADFAQGASGGGIFNDSGRLIGLATFLTAGKAGRNYAIPADWIPALAGTAASKVAPLRGSSFWEDVSGLPNFLKLPAPLATVNAHP
jgi:S1-C subfamily serine protease